MTKEFVLPPALEKGDKVAVVSTSAGIKDRFPAAFEMIMRHYAVESDLYPEGITEDNVAMRIPYRERIVPHSLRHTYATRLLRAGESMAKVSQLLGHEDPEVTVSIYGHLNVEDLREAAEKVSV